MLQMQSFDTIEDVNFFLQGGVNGGPLTLQQGGTVPGLNGLQLIFTAPAAVVTFVDNTGVGLSAAQIAAQIVAVNAAIRPSFRNNVWRFSAPSSSAGVKISKTGTANAVFGFSDSLDTVGTFFNSLVGAVPRLVEVGSKARLDGYFVVVEV
jgi:hypothetical protein